MHITRSRHAPPTREDGEIAAIRSAASTSAEAQAARSSAASYPAFRYRVRARGPTQPSTSGGRLSHLPPTDRPCRLPGSRETSARKCSRTCRSSGRCLAIWVVTRSPSIAARRETRLQDLSGLGAQAAIAQLRDLELRPAIEPHDTSDPTAHGRVIAHDPPAGEPVRRGQLITLLIGHVPDPPASLPTRRSNAHSTAAQAGPAPGEELAPSGERSVEPPADEQLTPRQTASADQSLELDDDVCHPDEPDLATQASPMAAGVPAARSGRRLRRVGTRVGAAFIVVAAIATMLLWGQSAPTRAPRPAVAAARPAASASASSPQPSAHHPPRQRPARRPQAAPARPELAIRKHSPRQPAARTVPRARQTTGALPATASGSDIETTVHPPASAAASAMPVAPPSPIGPLPGPYPIQPTQGGSQ